MLEIMSADLETVNVLYGEYARSTLPRGRKWALSLMIGLFLLAFSLVLFHHVLHLPMIHSLAPIPEEALKTFLGMQKEIWTEAEKEAETQAIQMKERIAPTVV
jgi:hypothetical protein